MKPYYQRELSDFSDDIITVARQGDSGLWYAVMNRPNNIHGRSMPDFSSCGNTRADAVSRCAQWIRNDAQGIGKYAPHGCLKPGYEFHWILAAHWARCMGEQVNAGRPSEPDPGKRAWV